MTTTARARALFADQLAAGGPSWSNVASSVRSGYTNIWIAAGIAAIEAVLRLVPDDEEDDAEGRRA